MYCAGISGRDDLALLTLGIDDLILHQDECIDAIVVKSGGQFDLAVELLQGRVLSFDCESDPRIHGLFAKLLVRHAQSRSFSLTDSGLSIAARWAGGSVVVLDLSATSIAYEGLFAVGKCCSNLESLSLAQCDKVNDLGLGFVLSHCKALKALDLTWCTRVVGSSFSVLLDFASPMTHLTLSFCWRLTNSGMFSMAWGCRNLKTLVLNSVKAVSLALPVIAMSCQKLEHLSLSACSDVTNDNIATVAKYCTQLTSIDLGWCRRVTRAGLECLKGVRCTTFYRVWTIGEPFFQFDDLMKEVGAPIMAHMRHLSHYGLFLTCRKAYMEWQAAFLADEEGATWFSEMLLRRMGFRFDITAHLLERRVKWICPDSRERERFQALFLRLFEQKGECRSFPMTDIGLALVAKGCKNRLKELDLDGPSLVSGPPLFGDASLSDVGLAAVTRNSKKLERANLVGQRGITEKGFCAFIESSGATLVELDFGTSGTSDKSLYAIAAHCTTLQKLQLLGYERVAKSGQECPFVWSTTDFLLKLDRKSRAVSDLRMRAIEDYRKRQPPLGTFQCASITDRGVCTLLNACGGGLVELSLCNTAISDEALFAIATHCPRLERLDLSHCTAFTDKGLGVIMQACTSLKALNLSFCTQIMGTGVVADPGRAFPLTELILLGCHAITAESLEMAIMRCPYLVTIDLSAVPAAPMALPSIAKSGAAWHSLGLAWLPRMSDASLATLARCCSQLRILDLQGDTHVTDAGLRSIAEGVRGLTHINMHGTDISDIGLCVLAAYCQNLVTFDGTKCHRITDMGIQGLLMACSHLETLFLGGTGISDVGLLLVAKHGRRLRQFGLADCPQLTKAGITRLSASRRDIFVT